MILKMWRKYTKILNSVKLCMSDKKFIFAKKAAKPYISRLCGYLFERVVSVKQTVLI